MDKQYFVNVVNLETGKIFSLPTLYTDRTEACVCGQNYCRDRQVEDPCFELFFRVLIAKDGQVLPEDYLWDDQLEEEEDDFNWENPACQCPDKQKDCFDCPSFAECSEDEEEEEEDAEEPSYSLSEILSVFNAIRPNY